MTKHRRYLDWGTINHALKPLQNSILHIYGVPRGGMILSGMCAPAVNAQSPSECDVILDDIIDSGTTKERYAKYKKPFIALCTKEPQRYEGLIYGIVFNSIPVGYDTWVQFPWEEESSPEDAVIRLLSYIGEDSKREGLKETPKRVTKALREMCRGYDENPKSLFTVFEAGTYNQMIVLENIEFTSLCEHHMLPFSGTATIGYIPDKKIVGISKLARLVEVFARRLQVQERLTVQICDTLEHNLKPVGCGVVIKAHHSCMSCRGVRKTNTTMITSDLKGSFFKDSSCRAEFLRFVK